MFKDILKQLRVKRGLTQEELADILGVKPGTIGNYEQGQRLPKDDKMWIKIAKYFNVTIDYLMDVDTDTPIIIGADTINTNNVPTVLNCYDNPLKTEIVQLLNDTDNIPEHILLSIKTLLEPYKK